MKRKHFYIWLVAAMLTGGALMSCGDDDNKKDEPNNQENTENNQNPENNQQNPENNEGQTQRAAYTPLQTSAGTIPADAILLADAKNPAEVLKAMGMGWNLGNQFDANNNGISSETAWGQPKATQATFDKVAAAGIKTVRIPVTWMGHIGEAPDYKIEDAWLDRIAEVVGYAENAGLNAIINIHHDGSNSQNWLNIKGCATNAALQKKTVEQVSAMWKQIAEKFKDKGHFLILNFSTKSKTAAGAGATTAKTAASSMPLTTSGCKHLSMPSAPPAAKTPTVGSASPLTTPTPT